MDKPVFEIGDVIRKDYIITDFDLSSERVERYKVRKKGCDNVYNLVLYMEPNPFFGDKEVLDRLNTAFSDRGYLFVKTRIKGKMRQIIITDGKDLYSLSSHCDLSDGYTWFDAREYMLHLLPQVQRMLELGLYPSNINADTVGLLDSDYGEGCVVSFTDWFQVIIPSKTKVMPLNKDALALAPECSTGAANYQVLVYAMGALMYRMLIGIDPLRMSRHMIPTKYFRNGKLFWPKYVKISDEKKLFVEKAMAADPKDRFQSLSTMLMALTCDENLKDLEAGSDKVFVASCSINSTSEEDSSKKEEDVPSPQPEEEKTPLNEPFESDDIEDEVGPQIQGQVSCPVHFKKADDGAKGFADVAGMEDLKEQLNNEVLWVYKHAMIADMYRVKAPNGMLLWGPPGCGKSFIAQKFAEQSHMNYALVKGSDISNIYIHGSSTMISDLFKKAAKAAPCILCIDEIDSFIGRRDAGEFSKERQEEVNEFLAQLNNCAERGIFVVGTTNLPMNIDPAVLRSGRLEKMVYVKMPDLEARKQLIELELKDRPLEDDVNIEALAQATEGYVASDISRIANAAALKAAMSVSTISQQMLLDSIKSTRMSITQEEAKKYEKMEKQLQGECRIIETGRPTIGFNSTSYSSHPAIVAQKK